MRRLIVSVLPISFVLFLSGCFIPLLWVGAGAAAGAGAAIYVSGELRAEDDVSLSEAYEAARQAVVEVGLDKTTEKLEAKKAEVEAQTSDDKNVTVSLEETAKGTTKIGIRVGFSGDKVLSSRILERMRAHYPPGAEINVGDQPEPEKSGAEGESGGETEESAEED